MPLHIVWLGIEHVNTIQAELHRQTAIFCTCRGLDEGGRSLACVRTTFVVVYQKPSRRKSIAVQLLGRTHVLDVGNHLGGDVVQCLLHNFPQ